MYCKNHASYVTVEVSLLFITHAIACHFLLQYLLTFLKSFEHIAEGKARPGHFKGVATIVTKLFNIVQPTNAYFGQKDAAQCCLIKRIVEDLDMPVNVNIIPTMRESDGLAMSSRNAYLAEAERLAAPVIYKSLCAAKDMFSQLKEDETILASVLEEAVQSTLKSEPLVSEVQYVAIDDKATMLPLEHVKQGEGAIISLACKIGSVRLIDNIVL